MSKPDNYQLMELQAKPCYFATQPRNSLRRTASADGRVAGDSHTGGYFRPRPYPDPLPKVNAASTVEFQRPSRREHENWVMVRGQDHRGYPMQDYRGDPGYDMDYKQPLLPSVGGGPVYVLMPASVPPVHEYYNTAASCYGVDGSGKVDSISSRRRNYLRDSRDRYGRDKSCCSCWKCTVALMVILAIIGVGIAVAGVVLLKLIDDEVVAPTIKGNMGGRTPVNENDTIVVPAFDLTVNDTSTTIPNSGDAAQTQTTTKPVDSLIMFDMQIPSNDTAAGPGPSADIVISMAAPGTVALRSHETSDQHSTPAADFQPFPHSLDPSVPFPVAYVTTGITSAPRDVFATTNAFHHDVVVADLMPATQSPSTTLVSHHDSTTTISGVTANGSPGVRLESAVPVAVGNGIGFVKTMPHIQDGSVAGDKKGPEHPEMVIPNSGSTEHAIVPVVVVPASMAPAVHYSSEAVSTTEYYVGAKIFHRDVEVYNQSVSDTTEVYVGAKIFHRDVDIFLS